MRCLPKVRNRGYVRMQLVLIVRIGYRNDSCGTDALGQKVRQVRACMPPTYIRQQRTDLSYISVDVYGDVDHPAGQNQWLRCVQQQEQRLCTYQPRARIS